MAFYPLLGGVGREKAIPKDPSDILICIPAVSHETQLTAVFCGQDQAQSGHPSCVPSSYSSFNYLLLEEHTETKEATNMFMHSMKGKDFFCSCFQSSYHSFIFPLQAHCLCVQIICTSQSLCLYWWQCPGSNPDVAGKQAEARWLFPKCWNTLQQCLEGGWELLICQIYTLFISALSHCCQKLHFTSNVCPMPTTKSPHLTMSIFSSVTFPAPYFTSYEHFR